MTNSVEPATAKSALMRHRADGLLGLSLLGTLPLVVIFCSDLWFRSDLRLFPLLMLVPIGLAGWRAWRPEPQLADSSSKRSDHAYSRQVASLSLWTVGGVCSACAPLLFSPWLALLGLTLAWIAWLLWRFESTPWPRLLKWSLPLGVLLLLPLGERSNPLPEFASHVTYAASSLLDLLRIDHLPIEQTLQLSKGRYDVAAACRGLGNPYVLFGLVVLMCIGTRCSLSAGLLTTASSPFWSWGGSVLLVVLSVWLFERQEVFIWTGPRLWIAQSLVLLGGLFSALLFKWGLQKLMAPFMAHSAGVGAVHKFFNRVVLWPEPDPLRMRRPSARSQPPPVDANVDDRPWLVRRGAYILTIAAGLFIACNAVSVLRLMANDPAGWPNTSELLTHARFSQLAHSSPLVQDTLPEELLGMRLIGFEQFATPGTTTGKPVTSRWTFINEKQTVSIQSDAAYRGAIAIERQRILDGSRLVERQPAFELRTADAGEVATQDAALAGETTSAPSPSSFRIEALTLDDPILGRSHVSYTNWPIDGGRREALPTGGDGIFSRLRGAIAYRPSSVCVSLWLEGSLSLTTEEKDQLLQMLVQAAEMIRRTEEG